MKNGNSKTWFFLNVRTGDCEDLVLHKVYRVIPGKKAEQDGFIRVVDESGEDYLYPQSYFAEITLPQSIPSSVQATS
ncbi:MAG: hypothetical protein JXA71_20280 [Chitinispirillaceae bacterium]|nr:hypothetical protein [Chitinispirillaceae bacterium]